MSKKKASIIFVLAVLEAEAEYRHPMSQGKIAELLTLIGIPCDRKTVGRDIKVLQSVGYPIRRTSKGFYIEKKIYTLDEVRFVAKCIRNSNDTGINKEDLVLRLKKTMGHAYSFLGE